MSYFCENVLIHSNQNFCNYSPIDLLEKYLYYVFINIFTNIMHTTFHTTIFKIITKKNKDTRKIQTNSDILIIFLQNFRYLQRKYRQHHNEALYIFSGDFPLKYNRLY